MTIQTVGDLTSFKWGTITGTAPLELRLDGDSLPLALIPESLVDPNSLWVGARVRVELSLRRVVIHGVNNGGEGFGSGDIVPTARWLPRNGWLMCRGQSLARADYPGLFQAIGTLYGAVDAAHFSVPSLAGRVLVGLDSSQLEFNALGKTGGEKAHKLTIEEMPAHRHTHNQSDGGNLSYGGDGSTQAYTTSFANGRKDTGIVTGAQGQDQPHNNLQPYAVVNYMIKI